MSYFQSEKLRIDNLHVEKLFNMYTYDIDFRNECGISILTAPNGAGKTTILKLIYFIFNPNYRLALDLTKTPFDYVRLRLSNGADIRLEKRNPEPGESSYITSDGMIAEEHISLLDRLKEMQLVIDNGTEAVSCSYFDAVNKGLEASSFAADVDLQTRTGIQPDLEEITDRYLRYGNVPVDSLRYRSEISRVNRCIDEIGDTVQHEISAALKEHNCYIKIEFINCDRLNIRKMPKPELQIRRRMSSDSQSVMEFINAGIVAEIQLTSAEYEKQAAIAAASLPEKYLKYKSTRKKDFADFKGRWEQYTGFLKQLYDLGLIKKTNIPLQGSDLEVAYDEKRGFLEVFLDSFEETLTPWRENYDRFKRLAEIFNKRNLLTGKCLTYGREGIEVHWLRNGKPAEVIELDALSSGEKNDLVMWYDLIFRTAVSDLVLIDEPEISLHIEWQEQYLDELQEICVSNDIRAIIATHSPNILHGHIELLAKKQIKVEE